MQLSDVMAVRLGVDPRLVTVQVLRGDAAIARCIGKGLREVMYAQSVDVVLLHPAEWCPDQGCPCGGRERLIVAGQTANVPELVADLVEHDTVDETSALLLGKLAEKLAQGFAEHHADTLEVVRELAIVDAPTG